MRKMEGKYLRRQRWSLSVRQCSCRSMQITQTENRYHSTGKVRISHIWSFVRNPKTRLQVDFFFFWTNILKICPKLSASAEWKSYLCLHVTSSSCQRTLIIPTNKKSESWSVVEQPESGNLNVFAIKNSFSNNESTYQWKHE